MDNSTREIEALRKEIASMTGRLEKLSRGAQAELGERFDDAVNVTREKVSGIMQDVRERGRTAKDSVTAVGKKADDYARENPWQTVAVATAVGLLIGWMASREKE